MSQRSYLVYGPAGCGKTRNAAAIAAALGLRKVLDNWEPGTPVPPTDTLVLTNHDGPLNPFGRRVMSYSDAIALVNARKNGGAQ